MAIFSTQYAQWYQFFEGLSVSPLDFYQSLAKEIEERKVPETKTAQIEFLERGLLSSKRLYFKIKRDWLTYHVCAAPFGTGFFVSSRLITSNWNSWPLLLFPLAIPVVIPIIVFAHYSGVHEPVAALVFGWLSLFISFVVMLVFIDAWFARNRMTYYRLDTMAAFQDVVHSVLVRQVNKTIESAGRKPLSAEESKPILHKLLQR